MALTRRAILITAPDITEPVLPGAKVDPIRFRDFLESDFGGAWERDEITILHDPAVDELDNALSHASIADYAIITFSGHGEHHQSKNLYDTALWINSRDPVYVRQLNPRNQRHLVIVDACRKIVQLRERYGLGGIAKFDESARTDRTACRKLYDEAISAAEIGRVVMYSCQIDQSAGETADGGFFSRFIVEAAEEECSRYSDGRGVLYTPNAFTLASKTTYNVNAPQSPVLEAGRRLHHFPFGVVAKW